MRKNLSPWLHQLDPSRVPRKLDRDTVTDVAIVGAGIAGTATAFFILKHTDKKVILLERFKVAHGATGHNAGQVASYVEKGFKQMSIEFGATLAAEGQRAIEGAWDLLEEMYEDAKLNIFFHRGVGHDGYSTGEQVTRALEEAWFKREAGLTPDPMVVAVNAPFLKAIPAKYIGLYKTVPHGEILHLLETKNTEFWAVSSQKRGCINSALFCERILEYLLKKYHDRFMLYEHAPVNKLLLRDREAVLDVETHTVTARRVVLCTNGFTDLHIINANGLEIDAKFHHLVHGKVAYMSAYLEEDHKLPVAISYETPEEPSENLQYYYLTRRPYGYEKGEKRNLISVGGPDEPFEGGVYSRDAEYPEEAIETIDAFVHSVYARDRKHRPEYVFTWHGLMGYTKNGMRMVGPEPQNPVLLYNLGCNGVGILPSVMGGHMLARHLAGERIPRSIFDIPAREEKVPTVRVAPVAARA